MWILPLVGYLGVILGFSFLVLAIASGLYYLSELVEEHTVLAKKLLTRMIYAVTTVQLALLLVDRLPLWPSALSIASHGVYAGNLRRFPIVKLTDPLFVSSCVLVLLNHYLWFRHFSAAPHHSPYPTSSHPRRSPHDPYAYADVPSFTEVAAFFGLCVWLVPFSLFVSLSASENVLPSMGSEYATGAGSNFARAGREPVGKERAGLAKAAVDGVRGWVGEAGELLGVWKGDRVRPRM